MGAFILAGLVFVITFIVSAIVLFGDAMSDETGLGGTNAGWFLLGGTVISLLILASHWMPPIGW